MGRRASRSVSAGSLSPFVVGCGFQPRAVHVTAPLGRPCVCRNRERAETSRTLAFINVDLTMQALRASCFGGPGAADVIHLLDSEWRHATLDRVADVMRPYIEAITAWPRTVRRRSAPGSSSTRMPLSKTSTSS